MSLVQIGGVVYDQQSNGTLIQVVKISKLSTYRAIYRLAARPYALSNAFGSAGRKQYATLHHAITSTKTLKLRHAWVGIESASAAAIVMAELVQITTAPVTANPAITPTLYLTGDTPVDAVAMALPTTPATEGALYAQMEWNLGITGAASVANPPPPITYVDLLGQAGMARPDDEMKLPAARPLTLEGFAVTLDCNAAATIKGYVELEFTEE